MPDQTARELFHAIYRREADELRAILAVRPDLVDAWITGNSWPNDFDGLEAHDSRGYEAPRGLDPLAYATVLGASECVEVLVATSASLETVSHGADMGWCTPLVQAAFQNKEDVLFILLRHGANPHIMGSAGQTALATAAEHGRSAMVDALLSAGAQKTIHVAALLGDLGEVNRFLSDSSAWLEAKDSYRQAPPLYFAAGANQVEVVRALVNQGADPDTPDNHPWTPLFRAAYSGHTDVAIALADLGANVNFVLSNPRWRLPAGTSVLHAACHASGATAGLIETLKRNGADTELMDSEGQLPMDVARAQSRDDLVAALNA